MERLSRHFGYLPCSNSYARWKDFIKRFTFAGIELRVKDNQNVCLHQELTLQEKVFKAMSPEQKLNAAARLYWSARDLKSAGLRNFYPELSEMEIEKKVREAFLYASS